MPSEPPPEGFACWPLIRPDHVRADGDEKRAVEAIAEAFQEHGISYDSLLPLVAHMDRYSNLRGALVLVEWAGSSMTYAVHRLGDGTVTCYDIGLP